MMITPSTMVMMVAPSIFSLPIASVGIWMMVGTVW